MCALDARKGIKPSYPVLEEGEKVKRMNIGTSCSKSKGWSAVPGLVSVLAERARADGARSMRAIEPIPATTLIICNDEVMSAKVNG